MVPEQDKATGGLKSLPIACTLTPGDFRERLGLIHALTAESLVGYDRDGLVLALRYAPAAVERVRAMVASERHCCAFLIFDVQEQSDVVQVTITAPGVRATRPTSCSNNSPPLTTETMNTAIVYVLASVGEIAGCFSFWAWLRLGKSPLWLLPGMASLALFACLLTKIDTTTAGRAYAAYGSVYIVSSICWLWAVEGARPDRWDVSVFSTSSLGSASWLVSPLMSAATFSCRQRRAVCSD